MISIRLKQAALFAFALAALPSAALAQQPQIPPTGGQPQIPAEVQGWLTELQQLHSQLEELQQKAMQDPELSAAQQEIGESVQTAMQEIDPTLEQSMTRMQALRSEATQAQQSGDMVRLQQLSTEAQQIQQKFVSAQQQALQRPALAAKVEAFQTQLEAKMQEVDPKAEQLIARFQELEQKLSSAMQQAGPAGSPQ